MWIRRGIAGTRRIGLQMQLLRPGNNPWCVVSRVRQAHTTRPGGSIDRVQVIVDRFDAVQGEQCVLGQLLLMACRDHTRENDVVVEHSKINGSPGQMPVGGERFADEIFQAGLSVHAMSVPALGCRDGAYTWNASRGSFCLTCCFVPIWAVP